ncbi:hypothetical protein SK128_009130 [Halocaridina rubra]|uniref:Uncharacterized protein n=1 Tax=Halocaridina rubra TaxID=373956 RepID=A0AAN8WNU8_HALRR
MPKMFSWAKKISGRSPAKDAGQESTTERAASPDTKRETHKSIFGSVTNNPAKSESLSRPVVEGTSEKKDSLEDLKDPDNGPLSSPKERHSSESKPVSEKRHYSESRPRTEKPQQTSVKKTSSFTRRLASFRFPSLERDRSDKRSRLKSKSPELNSSVDKHSTIPQHPQSPFLKNSTTSGSKSDGHTEIAHQHRHVQNSCESNGIAVNGNHQNSNDSLQGEQNSSPSNSVLKDNSHGEDERAKLVSPLSNISERRSISAKLYGEVIKEFDKIRTTKPKLPSIDDCEARTKPENPEIRKETSQCLGDKLSSDSIRDSTANAYQHNNSTSVPVLKSSDIELTSTGKCQEGTETTKAEIQIKETNQESVPNDDLRSATTQVHLSSLSIPTTQSQNAERRASLGTSSVTGSTVHKTPHTGLHRVSLIKIEPLLIESEGTTSTGTNNIVDETTDLKSLTAETHKAPYTKDSLPIKNKPQIYTSSGKETSIMSEQRSNTPDVVSSTASINVIPGAPSQNSSAVKDETSLTTLKESTQGLGKDEVHEEQKPPENEPPIVENHLSLESCIDDLNEKINELSLVIDNEDCTSAHTPSSPETTSSSENKEILPEDTNQEQVSPPSIPNQTEGNEYTTGATEINSSSNDKEGIGPSSGNILLPSNCKDHTYSSSPPESGQKNLVLECSASTVSLSIETNNPVVSSNQTKTDVSSSCVSEISDIEKDLSAVAPVLFSEMLKLSNESEHPPVQGTQKVPSTDILVNHSENTQSVGSAVLNKEEKVIPSSAHTEDETSSKLISEDIEYTNGKEIKILQPVIQTVPKDNVLAFDEPTPKIPPQTDKEVTTEHQVHTDPNVSCCSLEESSATNRYIPATNPIPAPRSINITKNEGILNEYPKTLPKASPRHNFKSVNRSNEEVSSQPNHDYRRKGSDEKPELPEKRKISRERISSNEGGSLPASPSAPRRKRRSRSGSAAGSLQTLNVMGSSEKLSVRHASSRDLDRPTTANQAPPRPPLPSAYSSSNVSASSVSITNDTTIPRLSVCNSISKVGADLGNSSPQKLSKQCPESGPSGQKASVQQTQKMESLNPFDCEDDEAEVTEQKPDITAQPLQSAKTTLNPFDSDDESEELEKDSNMTANAKEQLPPAGYNPFEDDEDEVVDGNPSQNASHKTERTNTTSVTPTIGVVNPSATIEPKNPFDEEEDDQEDSGFNENSFVRQSIGRHSVAVRGSSPFQRDGVRASMPCSGRGRPGKKKRQAPLPPGFIPSPSATPPPHREPLMKHGQSSTSLYWNSMRKDSLTTASSLSLSSPKRPPPPRPPPPRIKTVSLAQL